MLLSTALLYISYALTRHNHPPLLQVRYTFEGGNDGGGAFSIDGQGKIRLVTPLDREEKSSYSLVAVAVDSHSTRPQSSSVLIKVKVNDVNDNPPQFLSREFNVYVEENSPVGTTVAQIEATDPDEGVNAQVCI